MKFKLLLIALTFIVLNSITSVSAQEQFQVTNAWGDHIPAHMSWVENGKTHTQTDWNGGFLVSELDRGLVWANGQEWIVGPKDLLAGGVAIPIPENTEPEVPYTNTIIRGNVINCPNSNGFEFTWIALGLIYPNGSEVWTSTDMLSFSEDIFWDLYVSEDEIISGEGIPSIRFGYYFGQPENDAIPDMIFQIADSLGAPFYPVLSGQNQRWFPELSCYEVVPYDDNNEELPNLFVSNIDIVYNTNNERVLVGDLINTGQAGIKSTELKTLSTGVYWSSCAEPRCANQWIIGGGNAPPDGSSFLSLELLLPPELTGFACFYVDTESLIEEQDETDNASCIQVVPTSIKLSNTSTQSLSPGKCLAMIAILLASLSMSIRKN